MRHRQEEIRAKGFSFSQSNNKPVDFSRIKVGLKYLDDVIVDLGVYKKLNKSYSDKLYILRALNEHDYTSLREISNLFFETSGIYARLCKYAAYLYRYDWYLTPYIIDSEYDHDKVIEDFSELLRLFDNSNIATICGDIALEVIKNGCFYGYLIKGKDSFTIQELPVSYCRSRFSKDGFPVVEFNMRYFDDMFSDLEYRMRILKVFPPEFEKGYKLYKAGKLKAEFTGDRDGWFLLDGEAFKFNCGGSDFPIFCNAIPSILDLDEAQGLDRKKMMQKLLKIIIQKLPLDKNSDLVFDVDEAADIHNNAVQMLRNAVGVDVLTTFADIQVANMADNNTTTTRDDLAKVEREVYNNFGISQNLFNSDSNLALSYSVLNDEASIRNLQQQFQAFFNRVAYHYSKKQKKYYFRFRMLETTIYNYKDMSKMYKEQTQIGYSKMLPQVALGHSQSEIIGMAKFENEYLHLTKLMIPPMSSNTMNSDVLAGMDDSEESKGGRPEKDDTEKSDKTIANLESM